ncbi:hypothetical protein J6590_034398 [Homalodisca vitripennis]|nr:hypothetical protein J6590_034398 [Homalodisca vitripennis]
MEITGQKCTDKGLSTLMCKHYTTANSCQLANGLTLSILGPVGWPESCQNLVLSVAHTNPHYDPSYKLATK